MFWDITNQSLTKPGRLSQFSYILWRRSNALLKQERLFLNSLISVNIWLNMFVIGASETWFSLNKPAILYTLLGHELLHTERWLEGKRYDPIHETMYIIGNLNMTVTDNLESLNIDSFVMSRGCASAAFTTTKFSSPWGATAIPHHHSGRSAVSV